VNSRLHFQQLFLPSLSVLGRDNCSPANFAGHEMACFLAVVVGGAAILIGRNDEYRTPAQLYAGDPQAGRLHSQLDIGPAEIARL
jgi:hypothetical protein